MNVAEMPLRTAPPPGAHLKRRALVLLAAGGSGAVLFALAWGLAPSRPTQTPQELFVADQRDVADEVRQLPKDYTEVAPPTPAPAPHQPSKTTPATPTYVPPPPPPQIDEAERQRRRELDEARRSSIFFPSGPTTTPTAGGQAAAALQDRINNVQNRINAVSANLADADSLFANMATPVTAAAGDDGAATFHPTNRSFLEAPQREEAIYSNHRLEAPASPYQVIAGTVIPAALETGANSDLPGTVLARTTAPVYDTATGRHLLIPQQSKLVGTYNSDIAYGQSRILVIWTRLIMPDGSSILLDRLPGSDQAGFAGLADEVDNHYWRLFGGALLTSIINAGAELARGGDDGDAIADAIRRGSGDTVSQLGAAITRRNLNIAPTLTVRPGWPVNLIVQKDMILRTFDDHRN